MSAYTPDFDHNRMAWDRYGRFHTLHGFITHFDRGEIGVRIPGTNRQRYDKDFGMAVTLVGDGYTFNRLANVDRMELATPSGEKVPAAWLTTTPEGLTSSHMHLFDIHHRRVYSLTHLLPNKFTDAIPRPDGTPRTFQHFKWWYPHRDDAPTCGKVLLRKPMSMDKETKAFAKELRRTAVVMEKLKDKRTYYSKWNWSITQVINDIKAAYIHKDLQLAVEVLSKNNSLAYISTYGLPTIREELVVDYLNITNL